VQGRIDSSRAAPPQDNELNGSGGRADEWLEWKGSGQVRQRWVGMRGAVRARRPVRSGRVDSVESGIARVVREFQ
jgi:hypothetical protein